MKDDSLFTPQGLQISLLEDKLFHKRTIRIPPFRTPLDTKSITFAVLSLLNIKDLGNYLMVNKYFFTLSLNFLTSNQSQLHHQEASWLFHRKVYNLLKQMLGSQFYDVDGTKIETAIENLEEFKSTSNLPLTLMGPVSMPLYREGVISRRSRLTKICCFMTCCFMPKCLRKGQNIELKLEQDIEELDRKSTSEVESIITSLKNHPQLPQFKLLKNYLVWHQSSGSTPTMPKNLNSLRQKFCASL